MSGAAAVTADPMARALVYRLTGSVIAWRRRGHADAPDGAVDHPSMALVDADHETLLAAYRDLAGARVAAIKDSNLPAVLLMDEAIEFLHAELLGRLAGLDPTNPF